MSRGDDKPRSGNHGQHKATGKAGTDRLASQKAMENIRVGHDHLNQNQPTDPNR